MLNKLIFDDSILSFHRISRGQNNYNGVNSSLNSLTINKKDFEKQIVTLKKYFNIIDLNKIFNSKLNNKKSILEQVYDSLYKYGDIRNVKIPHSDVYYVRAALEARMGEKLTLERVEKAMRAEGWTG